MVFCVFFLTSFVNAQYTFEKYSAPEYQEYNNWVEYDRIDTSGRYDCTISIDDFFDNKDRLTIQLTWFVKDIDFGVIRVFRNKEQIQKIREPKGFSPLTMAGTLVWVSDINGDGKKDVKMVQQGTGNGVMSMLVKVMYLFQNDGALFKKVSFDDMVFEEHREERDIDKDGNYEILTMNLEYINGHSYWVFNAFEYANENLKNVNHKVDYPMVIQYKHKRNYKTINHLDGVRIKAYERDFPERCDIK